MIGAPWLKKLIAIIGSFLISNFALIPIKDATNCFKMFKKSMIDQISISSKLGFYMHLKLQLKLT